MGKRVKKKSRAPPKVNVVAHSVKIDPEPNNSGAETVEDVVSPVKERKPCVHFDKGTNLENLSAKLKSSNPVKCEDCRGGGHDRRGAKGKGKQGKKKGSTSAESNSDLKSIWICVECGHYTCAGVGFPTSPKNHAIQHFRQFRHPVVIQWENPGLRWCFPCNSPIPVEKIEDNGEKKDVLFNVVKLIKEGHNFEGSKEDVEDVWFGSGSVISDVKPVSTPMSDLEGRSGYVVRGLVNLGNTCFFNSVMQNLLAIERLREYFLNWEVVGGPLTISLKKLYAETKPESGFKQIINPRSFFACLCSKSPQFKGYQQHDSHELLRCLLDGLFTEESSARKRIKSSEENEASSNLGPTFVDDVFGGQISSTVCCVECGHHSTVYEPFLDLSLPVPSKKPPPKKTQPVARAKKTKLPPKRGGKTRSKAQKDADSVPTQSISKPLASPKCQGIAQTSETVTEKTVVSSDDSKVMSSDVPATEINESGSITQTTLALPVQEFGNTVGQAAVSFDDFTWLDYVEPEPTSDEFDLTSQCNDVVALEDTGGLTYLCDVVTNDNIDFSSGNPVEDVPPAIEDSVGLNHLWDAATKKKPDFLFGDPVEDELPLQVQDSEVLLLPYKEESSSGFQEEAVASSSAAGWGQEDDDFGGFGALFNEPEVEMGPLPRPSSGAEVAETCFVAGHSSESDPGEVDNTDSPVSVESCLAHFVKLELLSNENAWECENCTRTMQKLEAKKGKKFSILINGSQGRSLSSSQSLNKKISCPPEAMDCRNGGSALDCDGVVQSGVLQNGRFGSSDENGTIMENGQAYEVCEVVSESNEEKGEINNINQDQSQSSSLIETSSSGCSSNKLEPNDSMSLGNDETEESEHEEIDSRSTKVKRDATKRVLIDKAPPILTIHLKRFSQDARGRLSKLNGHVSFKEIINLTPYMDPRHKDQDQYNYRLVGVVEHMGNMRGGHYVASVRGGAKSREKADSFWYHASDAYVREVSLEEVLKSEAYILFYERIEMNIIS